MAGVPQRPHASARARGGRRRQERRPARDAPGVMGPAPGTIVLAFVFLTAFIVYFFVNWKILSFLWRIG